jgi:hypothetical protein
MAEGIGKRRVMRARQESQYVNTINLTDRVRVDFVWYPGQSGFDLKNSWVDTLIKEPAADGTERIVEYTWALDGHDPIKRTMNSGRINIPLPPGSKGTLTVFDTSWEITRAAVGEAMDAVANLRGIQQRINALGYHLRLPGQVDAGVDGIAGRRTESAVLAFQADYRPDAGWNPATRLNIRGEWATSPGILFNLNWYNKNNAAFAGFNPSAADSAALQAALVSAVGA